MKIVLATDGSSNADAAVDVMLFRPWPAGAQVKVISVVERTPPLISRIFLKLGSLAAQAEKAWLQDIEDFVDKTVERLKPKFGNDNVSGELVDGDPREKICEFARKWGADLILMGSYARSDNPQFLMGSVTDAVTSSAPCSVSVLRSVSAEAAEKELKHNQPIDEDKYLIPIDDSSYSDAMLSSVLSRPWPPGAYFSIIHVVEPVNIGGYKRLSQLNPKQIEDVTTEELREQKDRGRLLVEKAGKRFQEKFPDCKVLTEVFEGTPREKILEIATEWPADLVILGSRGLNKIEELKLAAVSRVVLFYAPCSVEIFHPKTK